MRGFTVPFNIDNEDKIIGGYVSLRQFFWLFIDFLLILYLFVLNSHYLSKSSASSGFGLTITVDHFSLIIRVLLAIFTTTASMLLAFFKIDEVNFDKYILMCLKYHLRKHILKI